MAATLVEMLLQLAALKWDRMLEQRGHLHAHRHTSAMGSKHCSMASQNIYTASMIGLQEMHF